MTYCKPLRKQCHIALFVGFSVLLACQPESTKDSATSIDQGDQGNQGDQNEACLNTFEATPLPDQQITEYGTDIPKIESALPDLLSETGLYSNISTNDVHPAMRWFKPAYELWSDGESKNRWVYIPECEQIDTSNMNDWSFPVGTRFFKEFSVDGTKVETRYVQRLGPGKREFAFVSYMWNEEQTEAYKVSADGMTNVLGTEHDIPSREQCVECHGTASKGGGRPSRGLGFSAIMLSDVVEGVSLEDLVFEEQLSNPPQSPIQIPGNATTKDALGYLHINCGTCHNQSEDGLPQYTMNLWIDIDHATETDSNTWQTTVDVDTEIFKDQHILGRIVPGDPDSSALYYRMSHRDDIAQMPPIATKAIDEEGRAIIAEWIESLQ